YDAAPTVLPHAHEHHGVTLLVDHFTQDLGVVVVPVTPLNFIKNTVQRFSGRGELRRVRKAAYLPPVVEHNPFILEPEKVERLSVGNEGCNLPPFDSRLAVLVSSRRHPLDKNDFDGQPGDHAANQDRPGLKPNFETISHPI